MRACFAITFSLPSASVALSFFRSEAGAARRPLELFVDEGLSAARADLEDEDEAGDVPRRERLGAALPPWVGREPPFELEAREPLLLERLFDLPSAMVLLMGAFRRGGTIRDRKVGGAF
ncbi:MAG: hypothetical protein AB7S26_17845 [Sandaracinaceae bacterium]